MNQSQPHPTLLRFPSWLYVIQEEIVLPLPPESYTIKPGDWWEVKVKETGETVYNGIGPVEVLQSPSPF